MGILKIVLFLILVFFIVRLVKLIARYRSSTKQSIDDLTNQQRKETQHFKDAEDADYTEIPPENMNESEDNLN